MSGTVATPNRFAFRSDLYAWFVVFVLCFGACVSLLERQVINLLVEPLKADLGISDTQISILQGFAFAIFYGIFSIPLGRMADTRNRVGIIIAGTILFSIATFVCGLATGFLLLLIGRMFVGVGEATLTPAGMSLLGDYFPPEKMGRAIGFFTGSTFAGSGLAFMLIGALLGWLGEHPNFVLPVIGEVRDWQLAFILAALPGFLFVALLLMVREPPRSDASGSVDPPAPVAATVRYMLANAAILGPLFIGLPLIAAANFAMNAWVPTFFIRTYGWQASEIGAVFGLYVSILGTGGVVTGGILSDWITGKGRKDAGLIVPLLAVLLSAPFVVSFPLAGDATRSLQLLAPAMFFGAMPFGAGTAGILGIAPNRMRGQIIAIYLLIASLIGSGVGPWAIALYTDNVLGDPLLIRYSIATMATALFLVGGLVIASGLRAVNRTKILA
ncbi:MAG: MFS transporter [Sphingomonadaceae bacterium]|nr:MFS transporter [Sphingomonadaceae bacterium]